jgi:hypothetical protein
MPCYDPPMPGYDEQVLQKRLDRATRAACELVILLKFIAAHGDLIHWKGILSKDTQNWIKEHEKIDAERESALG